MHYCIRILTLLTFILSSVFAYADACKGKKFDGDKQKDIKDSCVEKRLNEVTFYQEAAASAAHGITAVVCGVGCFSAGTAVSACKTMSLGVGLIFDIGGSAIVQIQAMQLKGSIDPTQLTGALAGTVGSLAPVFFGNWDTGGAAGSSSSGGDSDKIFKNDAACAAMFTQALSSVTMGAMAWSAQQQAKKADKNKKKAIADNQTKMIATNPSSTPNALAAEAGAPGDSNITTTSTPESDPRGAQQTSFAALANTPELQKAFKDFEDITGHPAKDVFDKMANGAPNGYVAALETAGDALPDEGKQHALELAQKATEAITPDLIAKINSESKTAGTEYASTARPAARAVANDDPFTGLGDALAGLLPQEQKEEKLEKQKETVSFGNTGNSGPSSAPNREGYYPSHQSIFSAVSRRYSILNHTVFREP
ncbi:MAG: hypothetical protein AB7F43_13380 [Bacteriovoracia bacterium]